MVFLLVYAFTFIENGVYKACILKPEVSGFQFFSIFSSLYESTLYRVETSRSGCIISNMRSENSVL